MDKGEILGRNTARNLLLLTVYGMTVNNAN